MKRNIKMIAAIAVLCVAALTGGGCASFNRMAKSWESNMGNGLNREVIVYDAMGNEIFRQSGKFDVDYTSERILYDDEQGKRHVIYFKTGSVVINEL